MNSFFLFWSVAWTLLMNGQRTFQRPLPHEENSSLTGAMMYLMKYGYMDASTNVKSAPLLSLDFLRTSVIEFQAFAGLNQTGVLDEETMELMKMPRCGVKDIVGKGTTARRRKKRYALQGSRWRVRELSYKISRYPSTKRLTKADVDKEIEMALNVWSKHTDLTFTKKTSGKVHIDIRFEKREHGDGDPFDGSGGTLAHAFFPVYGGDAHFDDEEYWTIGSYRGTNVIQTAAHEFGHSLGLSHSDQNSALMAPFYRGYRSKVELDSDDIKAIQILYGKGDKKKERKTTTAATTTTITTTENSVDEARTTLDSEKTNNDDNDNELCTDAKINAIVTVKDKTTYAFKGAYYWKLTADSIAPGYPRKISRDWDGLPSNLDAAFTWKNGRTYFFKGSKYWRFTNRNMDNGYPKLIDKGFEGIPNDVDAAFVWSGNDKIYFFKGEKYWRFDPDSRPPVKITYPKSISNWEGIPSNIDDALQYENGYTYFFKNGQYWRFNDRNFKVDNADPEFPRSAGFWWFGCKTAPSSSSSSKGNEETHNFASDRADVPPKRTAQDHGDEDLDSESYDAHPTYSLASSTTSYSNLVTPPFLLLLLLLL